MNIAAIDDDLGQTLTKRQIVVARIDPTFGAELAGEAIEHAVVLIYDRLNNLFDIE